MAKTKTDNGDFAAKLELRRYFLRKYHGENRPSILDCCQGSAKIWTKLRKEFECDYWGVDVKRKAGRLKVDSVRILQQPGWVQDVIDIDTYGSPWKHWEAMLPNVHRPLTVFLTIGRYSMGVDRRVFGWLGCGGLKIPAGLNGKLDEMALPYCLLASSSYGIIIQEAVEAVSSGNARYVGVRLFPKGGIDGARDSYRLDHSHV